MTVSVHKYSLLVAGSFVQAQSCAMMDWGWTQTGPLVFKKPDGERVVYVGEGHQFRGYERGTKLYLGPDWLRRPDGRMLNMMIGQGLFEGVYPEREKV